MSLRSRGHSAEYKAHLRSPEWARIRRAALERAHYRCAFCGRGKAPGRPLQVHHNTYVNLGHEQPEDLTVLCGGRGGCHQAADKQRRAANKHRRKRRSRRGRRRSVPALKAPLILLAVAASLKLADVMLPPA